MHFLLVVRMLLYPGVCKPSEGGSLWEAPRRVGSWPRKQKNPGSESVSFWDPRTVPKEERQGGLGVMQVGMETGSPEFKQAGQRSPKIRWLAPRTQIAWGSHHRPKHPLVDSISFPYKESRVTNWQRNAAKKASLASRSTYPSRFHYSKHSPRKLQSRQNPSGLQVSLSDSTPECQGSLSSPALYTRGVSHGY